IDPGTNPPGKNYTLTVTGTSGSVAHSSMAKLFVPAVDFNISAAVPWAEVSVNGGVPTVTINLNAPFGSNNTVILTVTGLPAGATPSFSPNPLTGSPTPATSTLTITTVAGITPATYNLTVTGTSLNAQLGNTVRQVKIALIVTANSSTL